MGASMCKFPYSILYGVILFYRHYYRCNSNDVIIRNLHIEAPRITSPMYCPSEEKPIWCPIYVITVDPHLYGLLGTSTSPYM